MDATKPHKVVLHVTADLYEMMDEYDNTFDPQKRVPGKELEDAGLKTHMIFEVSGFDRFDCIKKLVAKIDPLRNK